MPIKDQIKNFGRKLVEERPDAEALRNMVRPGKARTARFSDDGIVPNHSR